MEQEREREGDTQIEAEMFQKRVNPLPLTTDICEGLPRYPRAEWNTLENIHWRLELGLTRE